MATTKKTTIIESDEPVVETQPVSVVSERPVAVREGMSKQSMVVFAVISAVILFFLGLGLGYLLGRNTVSRGTMMNGWNYSPGMMNDRYDGGMMYRRYNQTQNNTGQTTPNQGTTNNNTQTAPNTQTN